MLNLEWFKIAQLFHYAHAHTQSLSKHGGEVGCWGQELLVRCSSAVMFRLVCTFLFFIVFFYYFYFQQLFVTGREYALKQVHIFSKNSQNCSRVCSDTKITSHIHITHTQTQEVKALMEEIDFLKEGIRHPNIVQYYGCHHNGEVFSILMEYMSGVSHLYLSHDPTHFFWFYK